MATTLVNNWLAIVKSSTPLDQGEKLSEKSLEMCNEAMDEVKISVKAEDCPVESPIKSPVVTNEIETIELQEAPIEEPVKMEVEDKNTISTSMFYKITIRDGKQVLTKLINSEDTDDKPVVEESSEGEQKKKETLQKTEDANKVDIKKEYRSKSSSSKSSNSSSKKSSSSKSTSSSSSKDKKHSSKHSSKSSSSSRDKDKNKKESDKDKHRSNGSLKHSSSNNEKSNNSSSSSRGKDKKDSKEKQAEKDKDTLEKLKPATLDKIGRIPKKPLSGDKDKEVKKKPSMSIEPKKKGEDRPKTVKIFNSKMRSTGLEEEAKPPPPRSAIKKPPPILPAIPLPVKRSSPTKDNLSTPPEKKMKLDIPERIGAIKLIPPKPKRKFVSNPTDLFFHFSGPYSPAKFCGKYEAKRKLVTWDPYSDVRQCLYCSKYVLIIIVLVTDNRKYGVVQCSSPFDGLLSFELVYIIIIIYQSFRFGGIYIPYILKASCFYFCSKFFIH